VRDSRYNYKLFPFSFTQEARGSLSSLRQQLVTGFLAPIGRVLETRLEEEEAQNGARAVRTSLGDLRSDRWVPFLAHYSTGGYCTDWIFRHR
jgi:hypothetical protein